MDSKSSTSQNLTILMLIILSISSIATSRPTSDAPVGSPIGNDASGLSNICDKSPFQKICSESVGAHLTEFRGDPNKCLETSFSIALEAAKGVSQLMKGKDDQCAYKVNAAVQYIQDAIDMLEGGLPKNNISLKVSYSATVLKQCLDSGVNGRDGTIKKKIKNTYMKTSNAAFLITTLL